LVPACTVESAVRDRQLQVALSAAGYGLTQTLAAASRLVARWENARAAAPYAWAVLAAARGHRRPSLHQGAQRG
jgi:hypothetical protein